jgi:hypothetical protein
MWPSTPKNSTATGWSRSSTSLAPRSTVVGSVMSASRWRVVPSGVPASSARAWVSTSGSLSTYTTRAPGAAARATSWVLSAVGSPDPVSTNWRTPPVVRHRREQHLAAGGTVGPAPEEDEARDATRS